MLRGSLDAITTSNYVEGWAYDVETPTRPLLVAVQTGGQEIARGLAHRYRWDLIEAGCGTGWCAFRLALDPAVKWGRKKDMTLWDAAGKRLILQTVRPRTIDDSDPVLSALAAVAAADPTVVTAIEQLRGCAPLFARFVRDQGAEAFVRTTYLYILGRPADPTGLSHYTASLRDGRISAFAMMETLYQSDEFRAAPRHLAAPPEPGFVFAT